MFPLVSCLTPTFNRREFFPRAVKGFLGQTYPNLEWVVVDNGDAIHDLLPDDERIKYVSLPGAKLTHGKLMNLCCEDSRGDCLIVLDDDDIYSSDRIARQIQPMISNSSIDLTGSSTLYYYSHGSQSGYQYTSPIGWLASIAFRKSAWEKHNFVPLVSGADWVFQQAISKEARLDLFDPRLVTAAIHPNNACPKNISGDYKPVDWAIVKALL